MLRLIWWIFKMQLLHLHLMSHHYGVQPNVLTQNSELRDCCGDSSFIDSSTGVGPAVCQTDRRDCQGAVDVQMVVAPARAHRDVQCLEQTKQPMNIKTDSLSQVKTHK